MSDRPSPSTRRRGPTPRANSEAKSRRPRAWVVRISCVSLAALLATTETPTSARQPQQGLTGAPELAQAMAEASMVGGLADWFAVVALFRHPLGLPIPHTAIITERKEQFGETLGEFIQDSFLTPDTVAERVRAEGGRALVVGGWVRDRLLGHPSTDTDVEVFGLSPERLRVVLESMGRVEAVGASFQVYKLGDLDVSLPRRESKAGRGHRGFEVTGDPSMSIEEAARRRD